MQQKETSGEQLIKTVTFRLQRYDPQRDKKPYFKNYPVPVRRGMTVLDGLTYIKEKLDGSLSFRVSCRMGVCGSCGMFINRVPHLACHTQILELKADTLEIRPLPNYAVVKDLVPDLTPLFEKHKAVMPYIMRQDTAELENPTGEFLQTPAELESYLQFAYCLKCGLCLAACPTMATDRQFLGPQALAQALRYNTDNRDAGAENRLKVVDTPHGSWRCHMAGACAEACPKGVDPALAIQLLKRQMALQALGFRREKQLAEVAPPPQGVTPLPNIPKAPEPTVKRR